MQNFPQKNPLQFQFCKQRAKYQSWTVVGCQKYRGTFDRTMENVNPLLHLDQQSRLITGCGGPWVGIWYIWAIWFKKKQPSVAAPRQPWGRHNWPSSSTSCFKMPSFVWQGMHRFPSRILVCDAINSVKAGQLPLLLYPTLRKLAMAGRWLG